MFAVNIFGGTRKQDNQRGRRSLSTLLAFLVGAPLGVGLLAAFHQGPLQNPLLIRYTCHPVEWATVVLFGCAVGALCGKLLTLGRDRHTVPGG